MVIQIMEKFCWEQVFFLFRHFIKTRLWEYSLEFFPIINSWEFYVSTFLHFMKHGLRWKFSWNGLKVVFRKLGSTLTSTSLSRLHIVLHNLNDVDRREYMLLGINYCGFGMQPQSFRYGTVCRIVVTRVSRGKSQV